MFTAKTKIRFTLVGLLLLFFIGQAFGKDLFREDFNQSVKGNKVGQGSVYSLPDGTSAFSSLGGDNAQESSYIEYSLQNLGLPSNEGTISVDVVRNENYRRESFFSLQNDAGERIVAFTIYWEFPGTNKQLLYVSTAGLGETIWYAENFEEANGFIALPSNVAQGQSCKFQVSWNETNANIYFNGQLVSKAKVDNPLLFKKALDMSTKLALGADVRKTKNPAGAYSMMASAITDFRVYKKFLTPEMVDVTPPEPVLNILAESPWGNEIKVSWLASVSKDVAYYSIYRNTGAKPVVSGVPYKTTNLLEVIDTEVVPGLEYFYTLVAVDADGNKSLPSDVVSTKALAGSGPAIASVAVEPVGKPARPGDKVTVTISGLTGCKAVANIPGVIEGLTLIEAPNTGKYVGSFTLSKDQVPETSANFRVVASLADDYGSSLLAGPEVRVVGKDVLNDTVAPVITQVAHNGFAIAGYSKKLVAGDELTVTIEGEKAGYAYFKLEGLTADQKMAESAPGVYTGTYTISKNDEGDSVKILGVLYDEAGNVSVKSAEKVVSIDTRVRLKVIVDKELLPADKESKSKIVVRAEDANGDDVAGHELALMLTTTSEYTGVVGGGKIQDQQATANDVDDLEVKWGGVTDVFGEVSAVYTSGFAAKTALLVAKDLTTGDVGVGWLNTFVASTVAIELTAPAAKEATADLIVTATPAWLTADGRSKTRLKVFLSDKRGNPIANAGVRFSLANDNGSVRTLRGLTDALGTAEADYRAGTYAGFVTVMVDAPEYGVAQSIQIELRSDAPAKIALNSMKMVLPADGKSTSDIKAVVTDINDNPNKHVPVMFSILEGAGSVQPTDTFTDDYGVVNAKFVAGKKAGTTVVEARHTSRTPNEEELRAIYGTIFVPRFFKDQERQRIKIDKWLVNSGEKVVKGQPVVSLKNADGSQSWYLSAPEAGVLKREVRFKRDKIELGETIGYVEIDSKVWDDNYNK